MSDSNEVSTGIMRSKWRRDLTRAALMLDEGPLDLTRILDVSHFVGTISLEMTRTAGYVASDATQLQQEQNQRALNERRDNWHE